MPIHDLSLTHPPIAEAAMLIRKPAAEVFEAIVDPATTSKFWFTKGSGRLEQGAHVQWDWEMYDVSMQVHVIEFETNRRIRMEWSHDETPTSVEWTFTPRVDDTTFVSIMHSGFVGDGDHVVGMALDSVGGFTQVLAGLKALLEHNISLNLVGDRFPKDVEAH
jgi:uncharacterized protein YndB with AHSA1/START domain